MENHGIEPRSVERGRRVAEFLAARDPKKDWNRCVRYLRAPIEMCETHTLEDIAEAVEKGHMHFWPGDFSAAITEVLEYPRLKVLNIFLAGGDLDELLLMEPYFCSWGEHLGCTRITLFGRSGWGRVLQSRGWQKRVDVLSKQLRQEQGVEEHPRHAN